MNIKTLKILILIEVVLVAFGGFLIGLEFTKSVTSGENSLTLTAIIGWGLITIAAFLIAISLKLQPVKTDIALLVEEIRKLTEILSKPKTNPKK